MALMTVMIEMELRSYISYWDIYKDIIVEHSWATNSLHQILKQSRYALSKIYHQAKSNFGRRDDPLPRPRVSPESRIIHILKNEIFIKLSNNELDLEIYTS